MSMDLGQVRGKLNGPPCNDIFTRPPPPPPNSYHRTSGGLFGDYRRQPDASPSKHPLYFRIFPLIHILRMLSQPALALASI